MSEVENQTSEKKPRSLWFGVLGAAIGGGAGYALFFTLLNQAGLYAMVLPGALIGVGRVTGSRTKSIPLGIACGVAAALVSLYLEWRVTPLPDDATIADFLKRLPDRPFRSQASLVAGPLMALWFGIGRSEGDAQEQDGG